MKRKDREWTDKAAEKIAGAGIKVQTKFADGMSRLTRKISPGKLKVILVIFCVAFGGYSVYLFGDGLFSTQADSTIKVQQLTRPQQVDRRADENLLSTELVDEFTYREIVGFKKYMDSLKAVQHPLYDSVSRARPGLMDSVQILIEAYQQYR